MVDRTGQNALFALSDGTNRRTAPPQSAGGGGSGNSGTWPKLGAYLPGTTTFPMSATEVTNRARNAILVQTAPYAANVTDYIASMAAIKAANPNCLIFPYWICEQLPVARPSGGNASLWDIGTANNRFARVAYPSGTILVDSGTGWNDMNQTLTRPVGGKYWVDNVMDAAMALTPSLDGVMTDNSEFRYQYNFDWNESGSSNSANSKGTVLTINANIASIARRRDYLAQFGKKLYVNGCSNWFISYANSGVDTAIGNVNGYSDTTNLCYAGDIEWVAGSYGVGFPVSFMRIFYANGREAGSADTTGFGVIPSFASVKTYPQNATISVQPALGTRMQTTFGGWMKDAGGNNIYTAGDKSPNCMRAMMDFFLNRSFFQGVNTLIVHTLGPAPARFNDPNGPTGAWGGADKHARVCSLFPQIYSNFMTNYQWMEQVPTGSGVMSDMDELRFSWGTPDASNLGLAQGLVNWGSGIGNGYQNGVYVRVWSGTAGKRILGIWNPIGNGTQTVTLPFACKHISTADFGGSSPQATVNDGTNVSTNFTIVEHDAYLLKEQ